MRNHADPNRSQSREPSTEGAEIVDFAVPEDDLTEAFAVENLPGPDEFEALHGYPIDDEDD